MVRVPPPKINNKAKLLQLPPVFCRAKTGSGLTPDSEMQD
jgi:hypothetical protein